MQDTDNIRCSNRRYRKSQLIPVRILQQPMVSTDDAREDGGISVLGIECYGSRPG